MTTQRQNLWSCEKKKIKKTLQVFSLSEAIRDMNPSGKVRRSGRKENKARLGCVRKG